MNLITSILLQSWHLLLESSVFILFGLLVYQCGLIQIRGQMLIYLERAAKRERLPMCLKCGYDLTGNASGVCPECGKRI